jgi:hypothetical protein
MFLTHIVPFPEAVRLAANRALSLTDPGRSRFVSKNR